MEAQYDFPKDGSKVTHCPKGLEQRAFFESLHEGGSKLIEGQKCFRDPFC